ncbi:MAG: SMC-Scp complex subunit ScpB [Planctomycetaceae bacterium]|nr:SMC-Scp complex subunit ScpB [Planctomycetaceae bacterium]
MNTAWSQAGTRYARPWQVAGVLSGQERIVQWYRQPHQQGEEIPCWRDPAMARLEASLFVADAPLSGRKLVDVARLIDVAQCQKLIEQLNQCYDQDRSSFRIEQVANGYQLLTRPEFSRWLDRIHQRHIELKLSPPALETLTIIAYHQPVTRADVEAIRGVQSSEVIKQLMERQLIRIGGEDDSLGRPYLYETTKTFLQYLGIRRIDQLPNYAELCRNKTSPQRSTEVESGEAAVETGSGPEVEAA